MSCNPLITVKFIEKYIDKPWDWKENGLSDNLFLKHEYFKSISYIQKQKKTYIKKQKIFINRIKQELMERTWHPNRFKNWCLDEEDKKN